MLGAAAKPWLEQLPALIEQLARRWNLVLEIEPPFELSYGYVTAVRRADGAEAVLKVSLPDEEEVALQIQALRHYAGDGVCRLLDAAPEHYAMLLERLYPGEMLVGLAARDDEAATRVGAEVMQALWRPAPADLRFKPLRQWFVDAFARHRAEYGQPLFSNQLFERAEVLALELLDSAPRELLLHGDFHHYNVLSAQRAPWLAIDPKGIVGDPGYEVGPFVLNPEGPKTAAQLSRRIDIFAEMLGYDRARLRDWCFAHAVLSACWSAENGGRNWPAAIAAAELLLG